MNRKKQAIVVTLSMLLCVFISSCGQATAESTSRPEPASGWEMAVPVPFRGYICAYSSQGATNSDSFLIQIPLIYPIGIALSLEDITGIRFGNDEMLYNCDGSSLFGEHNDSLYNRVTLSFRMNFDEPGEYTANTLQVNTKDGAPVILSLDDFIFDIHPKTLADEETPLELRGAYMLSRDYTTYVFEYENVAEKDFTIVDMTWDDRYYKGIREILVYEDSSLQNLLEGPPVFPAGETRTVRIVMDIAEEEYQTEVYCLFSPFIYFTDGEDTYKMEALTSPMVIQTPFPEGFQESLVQ